MPNQNVSPVRAVGGTLTVPGDKSISHRAIILGALSSGRVRVTRFLEGEDCLRTMDAFRSMGVSIERSGDQCVIHGVGLHGLQAPKQPIDCGNSGTTTRLLMGVLAGQNFEVELFGDASLSRRPMKRVMDPLGQMGASFKMKGESDRLPLTICGRRPVKPLIWKSPVASAQVKSAILLAGLYANGETSVIEPTLSRDHTERMLQAAGVSVQRQGSTVSLRGPATVRAIDYEVPADLSSAAFMLAAGLLLSPDGVTVVGVGVNPTRTGFLDIIQAMGGTCILKNVRDVGGEPIADIEVHRSALKGITIDGPLIPRAIDEFPILAVLATQANGTTIIRQAEELRVKESDRIASVACELRKMGATLEEQPDGLVIHGPTPLRGSRVKSYGDHRLAMSLAIAGMCAQSGTTEIEDVDCVQTSFPTFWKLLDSLRDSK